MDLGDDDLSNLGNFLQEDPAYTDECSNKNLVDEAREEAVIINSKEKSDES